MSMMTSSNGNIFRVTGPLCGEFTGPGEFPNTGQWRGALMFYLICARINGWANNGEAGDLRRYRAHCDVMLMRRKRKANFMFPKDNLTWKGICIFESYIYNSNHIRLGPRVTHWAADLQGPVSVSDKTSYRKISWSLEAARSAVLVTWIDAIAMGPVACITPSYCGNTAKIVALTTVWCKKLATKMHVSKFQ